MSSRAAGIWIGNVTRVQPLCAVLSGVFLSVLAPSVSAQTELITFQSNREGSLDVFLMDAGGSGVRRMTSDDATDHSPVITPDGTTIAFISDRDGTNTVFLLDIDSGTRTRVTELDDEED